MNHIHGGMEGPSTWAAGGAATSNNRPGGYGQPGRAKLPAAPAGLAPRSPIAPLRADTNADLSSDEDPEWNPFHQADELAQLMYASSSPSFIGEVRELMQPLEKLRIERVTAKFGKWVKQALKVSDQWKKHEFVHAVIRDVTAQMSVDPAFFGTCMQLAASATGQNFERVKLSISQMLLALNIRREVLQLQKLMASFSEEIHATDFAQWVEDLVKHELWPHTPGVSDGMRTLIAHMADDPPFRSKCFKLTHDLKRLDAFQVRVQLDAALGARKIALALTQPLAPFSQEPNAERFTTWVGRLVGEGHTWQRDKNLSSSVSALIARMESDAKLRATCFDIAKEALGSCSDRALYGYNQMQSALLTHRANEGELTRDDLFQAALQLFNRHALQMFAVKHASRMKAGHESLEAELYLETKLKKPGLLRDSLALPPSASHINHAVCARQTCKVTPLVVAHAHHHISKLHTHTGTTGLSAFLAGQGSMEFTAWLELLRKENLKPFETAQEAVEAWMDRRVDALGGNKEAAKEKAGLECGALWNEVMVKVVSALTPYTTGHSKLPVSGPIPPAEADRVIAGLVQQVLKKADDRASKQTPTQMARRMLGQLRKSGTRPG